MSLASFSSSSDLLRNYGRDLNTASSVYYISEAADSDDNSKHLDVNEDIIDSYAVKFDKMSEGRALGGDLLRADTLNEINTGLNTLSNIIKIVTTVLSLFGADNIDR